MGETWLIFGVSGALLSKEGFTLIVKRSVYICLCYKKDTGAP